VGKKRTQSVPKEGGPITVNGGGQKKRQYSAGGGRKKTRVLIGQKTTEKKWGRKKTAHIGGGLKGVGWGEAQFPQPKTKMENGGGGRGGKKKHCEGEGKMVFNFASEGQT